MLYGIMKGDEVLLVPEGEGRPIVEATKPEAPDGYEAVCTYADAGSTINQVWSLVPVQGTEAEAAVALAKMQAQELDDTQALEVAALYDEWSGKGVKYYGPDDPEGNPQSRVRFQGNLVKCISTHTSQPDWAPNAAPSLWTLILPGQDGSGVEVGVWQQPESTNGYEEGDRVIYDGHLWESTQNDNVWRPGDVGAPWTDLGEWDGAEAATAKAAGAHFAQQ